MKTIIISIITLCLTFSLNSAKSQIAFHKEKAKNFKLMEVKKCDAYKQNRSTGRTTLVKTHTMCNGNVRNISTAKHEKNRIKTKSLKCRK